MSNVTYTKVTAPQSGLCFSKGRWIAFYTVDGKRRQRVLGTEDLREAQLRRDAFYAALKAGGAVEAAPGRPKGTAADPGKGYIYKRKPFVVVVQGTYVGTYATQGEAEAARDKFMAKGGAK